MLCSELQSEKDGLLSISSCFLRGAPPALALIPLRQATEHRRGTEISFYPVFFPSPPSNKILLVCFCLFGKFQIPATAAELLRNMTAYTLNNPPKANALSSPTSKAHADRARQRPAMTTEKRAFGMDIALSQSENSTGSSFFA